jgi:hypothetical protein
MKLEEVRRILDAEWVGGRPKDPEEGDRAVRSCHASDLMSDVLIPSGACAGSLLLTGLTNAQVVRVAEISDFTAVCFVRGKPPQPEAVQLAEEKGISLLVAPLSMFAACGRLYAHGLVAGDSAKGDAD